MQAEHGGVRSARWSWRQGGCAAPLVLIIITIITTTTTIVMFIIISSSSSSNGSSSSSIIIITMIVIITPTMLRCSARLECKRGLFNDVSQVARRLTISRMHTAYALAANRGYSLAK